MILSTKTEDAEDGQERFHIQRQKRPKKQKDDTINKEKGGRFYQQRQKIKTRQFHQQRYRKPMTTQNEHIEGRRSKSISLYIYLI